MPPRALIVGAGIGGLAAALSLQNSGWSVRVFEKAVSPRELGFALNLASNAIAALRELGIADVVQRGGYAARVAEIRGDSGRVLRRIDARRLVSDSLVAMRPVVHGALLSAVGLDSIALGREAAGFIAETDGVTLQFQDAAPEQGDILIGADGIASAVRRQLHPHEPPPSASGYCALRGAVTDIGTILGDLDAVAYFVPRMEAAVVRAGPREAYWYMSLLTEDVARSLDPRALCDQFAARLDDTFQRVARATSDADVRFDELYRRPLLPRWGAGLVTLLGDAAHPMLPHTGQGAAQAMEDAVAIALALLRATTHEGGLRRYEEVRAARTKAVVDAGPRIARITTSRSRVVAALRNAAVRLAPVSLVIKALENTSHSDPHAALRD